MDILQVPWGVLLLCLIVGAFADQKDTCGYDSCPEVKEGYLNIHLVPHSHDDVGWLKTVDQYYYGDKSHIQQAAVQYTLDSVVNELQKGKDRRFIYVETGFFWRWWGNQDEDTKNIVRSLIATGQLEFISGGWVMNDEACVYYNAIVDQMGFGLRFLNETFGDCARPKVAWQIDPFGHSREMASIFAQMGFDGLFFGRLDYQDKYYRRVGKNMEVIWKGSPNNLGASSDLFTGALYNGYNPPDGYCFDIFCEDEPINDDPRLFDYNVDRKVDNFIKICQEWAAPYKTKNVLMTMGSDFQYMAAHTWYKNLDKLIRHVNKRQENGSMVNLIYSTPSCYLNEVNKAGVEFGVKEDDFFPYASDPHAFWTGYFTSRPTLKYFAHKSNNFLQVCKQLGMTQLDKLSKIWTLSEAVAILQHHDAVSGTAKQHVTDDYSTRLWIGLKACEDVISSAITDLIGTSGKLVGTKNKFSFCHLLNVSSCDASESLGEFVVSVYNPLARELNDVYIRVPVPTPSWIVTGQNGVISSQSVVVSPSVQGIPGRESAALYNLVFKADTLPALGAANFHLKRGDNDNDIKTREKLKAVKRGPTKVGSDQESRKVNGDFWVQNKKGLGVLFDGLTGLVKRVKQGESVVDLKQNFYFYPGMEGNNSKFEFRASGAYIFRPNSSESVQPKAVTERVFSYFVYEGEHVTEIHQVFTEWMSQIIRVYENSNAIEFEWLVGPIDVNDKIGKEIVTRYSSDLETNGIFYTDANGRELLKRKRDFRPSWNYKVYENVSGNYYPVNSRMIISDGGELSDEKRTLILLNDRAQGGTSMNDGEMELMVHRRLLHDDAFGVGEALDEQAYGKGLVAIGRHWLVFAGESTGWPVSGHRSLAQEIFMDRVLAFSDVNDFVGKRFQNGIGEMELDLGDRTTLYSGIADILPQNVHLLTLEPLEGKQFLLRLEHFYEVGESEEFSKDVKISIESLRAALPNVLWMRETTLGGNQWKDESKRLQWNQQTKVHKMSSRSDTDENFIVLSPMQIRTYVLGVK